MPYGNRFDADLSLDELLEGLMDDDAGDAGAYDEKSIPVSKVSKIVQQRLAKASRTVETRDSEFKTLFGYRPEEMLEQVRSGAWNPDEAMRVAQQQMQTARAPMAAPPQQQQQVAPDVVSRVNQIENNLRIREEAEDFKVRYPGVEYPDIPLEVKQYRAAHPNVPIADAMDMYLGRNRDKQAEFDKRQGAEDAMRSMQRGRFPVSQGSSTAGSQGNEIDTLSSEDRYFVENVLGMSTKQWMAANKKYANALGTQNQGGVT